MTKGWYGECWAAQLRSKIVWCGEPSTLSYAGWFAPMSFARRGGPRRLSTGETACSVFLHRPRAAQARAGSAHGGRASDGCGVKSRCAGLDVHKRSCVGLRADHVSKVTASQEVGDLRPMTRDLSGTHPPPWLACWLAGRTEQVALESTGVYTPQPIVPNGRRFLNSGLRADALAPGLQGCGGATPLPRDLPLPLMENKAMKLDGSWQLKRRAGAVTANRWICKLVFTLYQIAVTSSRSRWLVKSSLKYHRVLPAKCGRLAAERAGNAADYCTTVSERADAKGARQAYALGSMPWPTAVRTTSGRVRAKRYTITVPGACGGRRGQYPGPPPPAIAVRTAAPRRHGKGPRRAMRRMRASSAADASVRSSEIVTSPVSIAVSVIGAAACCLSLGLARKPAHWRMRGIPRS